MTRAYTAPELTKLRADGQGSRYYLAIAPRPVVFAARINQTFDSLDSVASLTYDGVTSGAYTAIKPDMTVYIGSSAGAYDIGVVRARGSATSSVLYIGPTSDVAFANDQYITVVNHYGWWPRVSRSASDGTIWEDWDNAYSAQHTATKPTVNLGDPVIAWLTSGGTASVGFSASDSWNLGGGTLTYAWTFPSASSYANETTATPSAVYGTATTYQAQCVVTAGGVSSTRYQDVYIYSQSSKPVTAFELGSISGDYSTGGWQFDVKLYAEAGISTLPPQAEVILFTRDYYQGVEGSIPTNIVARGWVDTETLIANPNNGDVSMTVYGPHHWLEKVYAQSMKLEYAASPGWSSFSTLTVDAALWHLVTWRSTINNLIDVYRTGDTRTAIKIETQSGSLWQQLKYITGLIMADVCCNAQGRLYAQVDTQYLPVADRSSVPDVMTFEKGDYRDLVISRHSQATMNRAVLVGHVASGSSDIPLYSLANGHTPSRYGTEYNRDDLLASTQAALNTLAAAIVARENRLYTFEIQAAAVSRMIDIAPRQYITLDIAAGDTPRGIVYSGNAIVRAVSWSDVDGTMLPTFSAECETFPGNSTNGDIPVITDTDHPDTPTWFPPPYDFPPFAPFTFPPPPAPPPVTVDVGGCTDGSAFTGPFQMVWSTNQLNGAFPTMLGAVAWKRCVLRSGTASNPTIITMYVNYQGNVPDHLHCYAIDSGKQVLATGIITFNSVVLIGDTYTATLSVAFSEVSPIAVAGFMLALDAGVDQTGVSAPLYVTDQSLRDPSNPLFDPFYPFGTFGVVTHTTTVTEYNSAGGFLSCRVTGTMDSNNPLFGYAFKSRLNLDSDTDIGGPIWTSLWLNPYAISGAGGHFEILESGVYVNYPAGEIIRKTVLADTLSTSSPLILESPMLYADGIADISFTMEVTWILSATLPLRWITFGVSDLINVCPAT